MGPIEIAVICVAAAIVAVVIGVAVWRKAKGKKGGCGCGCQHCSGCASSRKRAGKNNAVRLIHLSLSFHL